MSVAVDKAGQNRGTAEIDDLGIMRSVPSHFCKSANFPDAIALDPDCPTFDVAALPNVEQFSGFHKN